MESPRAEEIAHGIDRKKGRGAPHAVGLHAGRVIIEVHAPQSRELVRGLATRRAHGVVQRTAFIARRGHHTSAKRFRGFACIRGVKALRSAGGMFAIDK